MAGRRIITVVGCHAEGEQGDVITGGVLPPAGDTMMSKKLTFERDHDDIRRLLICEPRGSVARHVNLIVPSTPRRLRGGGDHHGADGVPADVGLQHHVHRHRAARDRR